MDKYYYSRGRRKTAHAQVRLFPGKGSVKVNKTDVKKPNLYIEPINLVGQNSKWDVIAYVRGGGTQSQIEAVRLGVARALVLVSNDYKTTLRKAGFLTRDPREKERKKPGLKRARRAPQWSKR